MKRSYRNYLGLDEFLVNPVGARDKLKELRGSLYWDRKVDATYEYWTTDRSFEDVGREYGVTRERMRQITTKVLRMYHLITRKEASDLPTEDKRN